MQGYIAGGRGSTTPGRSPQGVGVLAAGAVLLGLFVVSERRAADPVVPLRLLRHRLLAATNLVAACVGAILLGLTSYVPTFVQVVRDTGPLVAGFALAALTLGWPLSASQPRHVYLRIVIRWTALVGAAVVVLGTALLLLLDGTSSVLQVGATVFVVGLGMGFTAAPTLIAAQSAVDWQQRGVVIGRNMFFRSAGSAVGVAVFGALVNATPRQPGDRERPGRAGRAHDGCALGVPGDGGAGPGHARRHAAHAARPPPDAGG